MKFLKATFYFIVLYLIFEFVARILTFYKIFNGFREKYIEVYGLFNSIVTYLFY